MANEHSDASDTDETAKRPAAKDHGAKDLGSKRIHVADSRGGGGAVKWLAGAAVAALLVGGGYLFLHNSGPAPSQQAALNQEASDSKNAYNTTPSENPVAQPAAAPSPAASSAPRRVASNAPAEEVVGVMPASAAASDGDDIIVPGARRPVWAQRPSPRRLSEAYPYNALEAGREGEARVSCLVGAGGRLGCTKVSETPAHEGFGAAAVHIAEMYRHADYCADGSAAAGTAVNVRVVFRVGADGRTFN